MKLVTEIPGAPQRETVRRSRVEESVRIDVVSSIHKRRQFRGVTYRTDRFSRIRARHKENAHPLDGRFFMVDDIGLEPMTSRTSSGCSYQLS